MSELPPGSLFHLPLRLAPGDDAPIAPSRLHFDIFDPASVSIADDSHQVEYAHAAFDGQPRRLIFDAIWREDVAWVVNYYPHSSEDSSPRGFPARVDKVMRLSFIQASASG
jgi:hypothetical protein